MPRARDVRREHWERVRESTPSDAVSWFQSEPAVSLRLVTSATGTGGSVVDVGGGDARLVDRLLDLGYADVSVVDVSARALEAVDERLAAAGRAARLVRADVLEWRPQRTFDVWHDRAVFHFLTDSEDRSRYRAVAERALRPGGAMVLATFAPDGPTHCSGLEVRRYDAASLSAELGPGFVLEHAEREEHVTPRGAVQAFTWAVLRRR